MKPHATPTGCRSTTSRLASPLLTLALLLMLAGCASPTRNIAVAVKCPPFPEIPEQYRQPLPTMDLLTPEELPPSKNPSKPASKPAAP